MGRPDRRRHRALRHHRPRAGRARRHRLRRRCRPSAPASARGSRAARSSRPRASPTSTRRVAARSSHATTPSRRAPRPSTPTRTAPAGSSRCGSPRARRSTTCSTPPGTSPSTGPDRAASAQHRPGRTLDLRSRVRPVDPAVRGSVVSRPDPRRDVEGFSFGSAVEWRRAMSRQCPRCGHLAEDLDHFCASCGAELAPGPEAAFQTGVLGVRIASEGDSAPLPTVDPTSVGGLGRGHAVLVVLRGPQEGARFDLDPAGHRGARPCAGVRPVPRRRHRVAPARRAARRRRHLGDRRLRLAERHATSTVGASTARSCAGGDEVQIGKYRFVFLEAAGEAS